MQWISINYEKIFLIVTIIGDNKLFRQNKIEKLGLLTKMDIMGKFKHNKVGLGMIDAKIINLMDKKISQLHSTNSVCRGKNNFCLSR